jgi:hypothetical protein
MGHIPSEVGGPSVECAVTGSDQALVAWELLTQWRLPVVVAEAVRWARVPLQAPASRREAALLHIATRLSAPLSRSEDVTALRLGIDRAVWAGAGLKGPSLNGLPDRVAQDYAELSAWVGPAD